MLAALEAAIAADLGSADALAAMLRDLVASERLAALVDAAAERRAADPRAAAHGDLDAGRLVLLRAPRFVLSLHAVHGAPEPLCIAGTDQLVALVAAAPVEVVRYRVAAEVDLEVFEPGAPLALLDRRGHDGAPIWERRADLVVHDYESAAPFAKLCLALQPSTGQRWVFDRATLRASYPMLESLEDSGCIALCRMVAALAERRALPMLRELTDHASHAVRWSAIQAIGKLDGREARQLLERATRDAHPHVRTAAQRALDRLGAAAR